MSPVVRLTQDIYEKLESHAIGFDTPSNVIAKLLDYYEQSSSKNFEPQVRSKVIEKNNQSKKSRITQDELLNTLMTVLKKYNSLDKAEVESEVFKIHKDILSSSYYQGIVAGNVIRWKHNLAWARNKARELGLIKDPIYSGRGIWEITEAGKNYLPEN